MGPPWLISQIKSCYRRLWIIKVVFGYKLSFIYAGKVCAALDHILSYTELFFDIKILILYFNRRARNTIHVVCALC